MGDSSTSISILGFGFGCCLIITILIFLGGEAVLSSPVEPEPEPESELELEYGSCSCGSTGREGCRELVRDEDEESEEVLTLSALRLSSILLLGSGSRFDWVDWFGWFDWGMTVFVETFVGSGR